MLTISFNDARGRMRNAWLSYHKTLVLTFKPLLSIEAKRANGAGLTSSKPECKIVILSDTKALPLLH